MCCSSGRCSTAARRSFRAGSNSERALARAIVKDAKAIFLDEPLANLDYKLREELREQLPGILGERGTVVVYATSEPTEALLLGGKTALIDEGRIVQFGPTTEIYRLPATLTAARVFSDPPMNFAPVEKRGDRIVAGDELGWTAKGPAAALPDGSLYAWHPAVSRDANPAVPTGRPGPGTGRDH